eukprot:309200_1
MSADEKEDVKATPRDIEDARTRFVDYDELWEARERLRQSVIDREDPRPKKKLDASIKKTTGFIRKLKSISDHSGNVVALCTELSKLALSRYVSEVVTALAETKITRTADITAIVHVSARMSVRFEDFADELEDALGRVFASEHMPAEKTVAAVGEAAETEKDKELKALASKQRSSLRLLTELLFCGVCEMDSTVANIIKSLIKCDKGRDPQFVALSLLVSFVRYGAEEFCGTFTQKRLDDLKMLGRDMSCAPRIISESTQSELKSAVCGYFDVCCGRLEEIEKMRRKQEKDNLHVLLNKGEVSEKRVTKLKQYTEAFERLNGLLQSFAEYLNLSVPEFEESDDEMEMSSMPTIHLGSSGADAVVSGHSFFDDDETRLFYEDLMDLEEILPAVLLSKKKAKSGGDGDKPNSTDTTEATDKSCTDESTGDHLESKEGNASTEVTTDDASTEVTEDVSLEDLEADNEKEDGGEEAAKEGEETLAKLYAEQAEQEEGESTDIIVDGKKLYGISLVLKELEEACSRPVIDDLSERFCFFNSKKNRKKLVSALFKTRASRLNHLPYYGRLTATLSKCFPDIGTELVEILEKEFYGMFKRKSQTDLPEKVRNIVFIGELTKFGVCPDITTFKCLNRCLKDFSPHNIHVACRLLDTCGRWFFRNPVTHKRCMMSMGLMKQKSKTTYLEEYLSNMLENAYFQCCPPDTAAIERPPPLGPHKAYVNHLLFQKLNASTVDKTLRQLRKMDWSDPEMASFIRKSLFQVALSRFQVIGLVASIASGLDKFHNVGVPLVDDVLEEIRLGLEENDFSQTQKRTTFAKFLGELYVYKLVDSQIVFDTLYLLITFGVHPDGQEPQTESSAGPNQQNKPDDLDPPGNYTRIRLVCTVLETCGRYFDRGASKRRLDRFLLFFQRYILVKASSVPFPVDIQFVLEDVFEKLRPKLKRVKSLAEADERIIGIKVGAQKNRVHRDQLVLMSEWQEQVMGDGNIEMDDDDADGSDSDQEFDNREAEEKSEEQPSSDDDEFWDRGEVKKSEADLDFEKEFARITHDSAESRKFEKGTVNMSDAKSYVHLESAAAKPHNIFTSSATDQPDVPVEENFMRFRLLSRKSHTNKPVTRDLYIPSDVDLAVNTEREALAQREEQKEIKKLVMKGLQRSELEERDAEIQKRQMIRQQHLLMQQRRAIEENARPVRTDESADYDRSAFPARSLPAQGQRQRAHNRGGRGRGGQSNAKTSGSGQSQERSRYRRKSNQ